MNPGGMPPPQGPPRKKRYLFSFIIVVLLVGLVSAMVSTYLVFQLLGDRDGAQAAREPVQATEPGLKTGETLPAAATDPRPDTESATAESGTSTMDQTVDAAAQVTIEPDQVDATSPAEAVAGGQAAIAEELAIEVPDAIYEEQPADPETQLDAVPVAPAETGTTVVVDTPPSQPAPSPSYASYATNPEIWRRLDEFEIRGIMSRGAKVLIFDSRTQKARTYTPGDLIDGALSLRVAKILSGEIQFTDNEGSIFTKAF